MSQAVLKAPVKRRLPSPMLMSFAVMLVVTLLGLGFLARAVSNPAVLPITKVLVEGDFVHLQPRMLQAAVVDTVNAGFFKVDVDAIRERLLNEPWIREATIRRVWPDTLHVQVVEQEPAVRWGEHALLNDAGDIFVPPAAQIPQRLPKLSGPLGTEITMLQRYRELDAMVVSTGLSIAEVGLSPRHAWHVVTADGKELILGRNNVKQRMRRFIFGFNRGVSDLWGNIGRVDLRYTNGFAVSRRSAVASTAAAPTKIAPEQGKNIDG